MLLEGLINQHHAPTLIVIADNDPERSAEVVSEEQRAKDDIAIEYLPIGENLGPAGAWAKAVEFAQHRSDRGDWVMVLDDDDPVTDPRVTAEILATAETVSTDIAGVGLRGARWNRPSCTLRRVVPAESAPQKCDYLASGGLPVYRWSVIDQYGFFDADLFFGFEDLDFGFRLRHEDLSLIAISIVATHPIADTATERTAWREYFKTRALVTICSRHIGRRAVIITIVRNVLLGGTLIGFRKRDVSLPLARWRGYRDAMRGRLGTCSYVPLINPAKTS